MKKFWFLMTAIMFAATLFSLFQFYQSINTCKESQRILDEVYEYRASTVFASLGYTGEEIENGVGIPTTEAEIKRLHAVNYRLAHLTEMEKDVLKKDFFERHPDLKFSISERLSIACDILVRGYRRVCDILVRGYK